MDKRRGEKFGWTGGWLGGFIWVAGLSGVFFFQGDWLKGSLGLALFAIAVIVILSVVPWRYPSTAYWRLMIAPFALMMASAAWAVWAYGGIAAAGIDGWALLWMVPLLIPFGIMTRRKWSDGDSRSGAPSAKTEPRR